MDGSSHTFDILPDQAYDYIDSGALTASLANVDPSLLYHGTLASRSPQSGKALNGMLSSISCPVFVDVNLRSPWSDGASSVQALEHAKWAKLNDEELRLTLGSCAVNDQDIEMMSEYLRSESNLDLLVVTLGEGGALMAAADRIIKSNQAPVDKIVDTVGAGDAFSSVVIIGLLSDWSLDVTLDRAINFAADVCTIRGATSSDAIFYQSHLKKWESS
jgi:fructokinase